MKTTVTTKQRAVASNNQLHTLFVDGLKDIYWAEKALLKALPKMAKKTLSPVLANALNMHTEETKQQVVRLESVFDSINLKADGKKCEAMVGLLKEGDEIVAEFDKGEIRDAGIIMACQKIEHYEIASYGTLKAFASILGYNKATTLLEDTLTEEKNADIELTKITPKVIAAKDNKDNIGH